MPNYSVSCINEKSKIIEDKALSPSKVFQLGIDVLEMGGLEELKARIEKLKNLEDVEVILREKIKILEEKHANSQEIIKKKNAELIECWAKIEQLEGKSTKTGEFDKDPVEEILGA